MYVALSCNTCESSKTIRGAFVEAGAISRAPTIGAAYHNIHDLLGLLNLDSKPLEIAFGGKINQGSLQRAMVKPSLEEGWEGTVS